jgi:LacI family transcriptional regulator
MVAKLQRNRLSTVVKDRDAPVTLQDVAREAGVSLATASRSLNGSTRKVNEEYRARVLAAAARLNYSPNLSAQAVAKGRSRVVALVVADIADPYFSSIAAGVVRAAESRGLIVSIVMTERRPERELELVTALRQQRPQLLILAGSRSRNDAVGQRLLEELQSFESDGGRVVLISQAGLPFDTIQLQNHAGCRKLAHRLFELGYRRPVIFAGPPEVVTATERVAGFQEGWADNGIEVDATRLIHGDFTRDGGYVAAGEYLGQAMDADVILAVNDVMAVGAMARLREAGVALPGDVAITGFDDIHTLRDVSPSLTTVHLPLENLGGEAVHLGLDSHGKEPQLTSVEGKLVIRQSTPTRSA